MNSKKTRMSIVKKILIIFIIASLLIGMLKDNNKDHTLSTKIKEELEQVIEKNIMLTHLPIFVYASEEPKITLAIESHHDINEIIVSEGGDEDSREHQEKSLEQDAKGIIRVSSDMEEKLAMENGEQTPEKEQSKNSTEFASAVEKKQEFDWNYYASPDTLIEDFYAIDSTTGITGDKLRLEKLLKEDMTLKQDNTKPQILIYHTHSQEGFADSVSGEPSTTIVGAGERLSEILRDKYNYNVIHHTGEYDTKTRDYAYSYSLPEIEKLLDENPSIEVVIDLHRDAAKEGTKLVTDIDGRTTAKIMFFNGLSYTNKQGEIDYLKNPYIQENLAFSFQMQVLCNEYYPDFARRIYLKGYRYNMHLREKTLLVEMGAQTNTTEEIWNAVEILADVLDKQLSGVDR